jgi:hypothetical protein
MKLDMTNIYLMLYHKAEEAEEAEEASKQRQLV